MAGVGIPFRFSSTGACTSSFSKTSRQLQSLSLWSRRYNVPPKRLSLDKQCRKRLSADVASTLRPNEAYSTARSISQAVQRHQVATSQEQSAYKPPTTGLIARLPAQWIPYVELIRLDKPAGTYYLFLPCLFSTLAAAPLAHSSPMTVISTSTLFLLGALIMRGAGCTINDLWDRNLDPRVARTRLRPIARGAISVRQAIPYLGVQLLCGLGVLLQFPHQCLYYGIPSLLLVVLYPLAKRVTNYPQFVLGLTFSWGAFMGYPALGIDLLANTPALISAACLYSSCVAWTVVYDMIYAYQDIRDDSKAGIKSIALAHEPNAKAFLIAVSAAQVALLAGSGLAIGAGPLYFVGTCGGAAATLGYMIFKVNLNDVRDCWMWFRKGAWFTGGAITLGLVGEYITQYLGWRKGVDEKVEKIQPGF